MRNLFIAFAALTICVAATSCGSETNNNASAPIVSTKEEAYRMEEGKIILSLEGDDAMKYSKKELKVKAGVPVKLYFHHTGNTPKTSMGHNVVILKDGVNMMKFANMAIDAKDTDYIPAVYADSMIAHTPMLGGGEKAILEFTIDKPGSYVYFCSFPGHSSLMKGVLIVE